MNRGELWTVSGGVYAAKPRPALIIQDNLFSATESVVVIPLTTTVADVTIARIAIPPTATGPVMLDCREPRPVKPQTFEARVQDVEASGRLGGSQ